MKFNVKTLAISSILLSGVLLTGCQSEPNTLSFTPATPQATMNVNQSAVVFVSTRDMRQAPEISSYVADGKVVKLSATPSVTELFQQVEQQNLISKGFRIGMPNNCRFCVADPHRSASYGRQYRPTGSRVRAYRLLPMPSRQRVGNRT